jgi:hypothetical protein
METVGSLIDKLTIVNIRIWMAEDIKRSSDDDKEIADATRLTNIANQLRNDLIQEIDEEMNLLHDSPQKLYNQGQTKMYGK